MLNTALLEALWWAGSKFNYSHTSHRVLLHCLCWKSILITIKLWNKRNFVDWWNKQTKENFTCSTRNCACRNRVSSVKVRQFTGGTDVCSKKGMTKSLIQYFSYSKSEGIFILASPCFEWRLITKSAGVALHFNTSWATKVECHDP